MKNGELQTQQRLHVATIVVRTCAIFIVMSLGLIGLDAVPQTPHTQAEVAAVIRAETAAQAPVIVQDSTPLPVRIIIDKIGVDVSVSSPTSTDVSVLDTALLAGAVRYPGSGRLDEEKNMLIFGHSSYLPVVKNKAFKSFNDLGKLTQGDIIRVQSKTHEYVYRVTGVVMTSAAQVDVQFDTGKKQLTLSTCNTFGQKTDRYVVTADFIGSTLLQKI